VMGLSDPQCMHPHRPPQLLGATRPPELDGSPSGEAVGGERYRHRRRLPASRCEPSSPPVTRRAWRCCWNVVLTPTPKRSANQEERSNLSTGEAFADALYYHAERVGASTRTSTRFGGTRSIAAQPAAGCGALNQIESDESAWPWSWAIRTASASDTPGQIALSRILEKRGTACWIMPLPVQQCGCI